MNMSRVPTSAITIICLSWALTAQAFSTPHPPTSCRCSARSRNWTSSPRRAGAVVVLDRDPTSVADSSSSSSSTEVEVVDVYDRLGIERGNLALGVKPDEVLQYIGTREDLIQKTMTDLPKLDRTQAETKVDQFLLDAEMIDLYIRFEKELEKNPDFVVPEAEQREEGLFSIRTVLILYIGYIGFGLVSKLLRNYVADQEIAGTWQGTNIGFIDDWIQKTSPEATQQALQRAAEAAAAAAEAAAQTSSAVVEAIVQTNLLLM